MSSFMGYPRSHAGPGAIGSPLRLAVARRPEPRVTRGALRATPFTHSSSWSPTAPATRRRLPCSATCPDGPV
jgi:hypothetical protein